VGCAVGAAAGADDAPPVALPVALAGVLVHGVAVDPAELDEDEQPAAAATTPATTASAARDGRAPDAMTEDTELPTLDLSFDT
jgi:hypothetical protein